MDWQLKGKKPPDKFVIAEMLAERYGWTLEEIKKIPKAEAEALLQIIRTKNKIQEAEHKKLKK